MLTVARARPAPPPRSCEFGSDCNFSHDDRDLRDVDRWNVVTRSKRNKRSVVAAAERAAAAADPSFTPLTEPCDVFAPIAEALAVPPAAPRVGSSSCVIHGESGEGAVWSRTVPTAVPGGDPCAECTCSTDIRPRLPVMLHLAMAPQAAAAAAAAAARADACSRRAGGGDVQAVDDAGAARWLPVFAELTAAAAEARSATTTGPPQPMAGLFEEGALSVLPRGAAVAPAAAAHALHHHHDAAVPDSPARAATDRPAHATSLLDPPSPLREAAAAAAPGAADAARAAWVSARGAAGLAAVRVLVQDEEAPTRRALLHPAAMCGDGDGQGAAEEDAAAMAPRGAESH